MSRRARITLMLIGAAIALVSAALLIFTLAPDGGTTIERATVAPTMLAVP